MEKIQVSLLIQNILWCAAGIVGAVFVTKLIRRKPDSKPITDAPAKPRIPRSTDNTDVINVIHHPEGSAKDAFVANIANFTSLFEALNTGAKLSEAINDAVIEINNKDLMEMWVKICKDHKAILRILAMWGIKREDEIQFQAQKHHVDRYMLIQGQVINLNKVYKVITPCWIYTSTDNNGIVHKSVAIKGLAQEI